MPELLPIRWEESKTRPDTPMRLEYWDGSKVIFPAPSKTRCDFCSQHVESGVVAVFDGVRGKIVATQIDQTFWVDGPFGACRSCQGKLGITPGDPGALLAKVRRLWVNNVRQLMAEPVRVAFYGPG